MRSVMMIAALMVGLGGASVAYADETRAVNAVVSADDTAKDTGLTPASSVERKHDIVPAQERTAPRGHRASYPLRGEVGWLIAGAAGALVPLALFAVPALVFAWFGPFAPVAFLVAIGVATVTTAIGGALAWAISALFSDMKSGFLLPILTSGLVGLGATFISGGLATVIIFGGMALSWLLTGGNVRTIGQLVYPDLSVNNPFDYRNPTGLTMIAASALAFLVWGGGVLTAAIGGPMTAAFMYRAAGTPKDAEIAVPVENRQSTTDYYNRDYETYPADPAAPR